MTKRRKRKQPTLAEQIKAWRISKGWTQELAAEWIADTLGLKKFSVWNLRNYEQGKSQPQGLARIALLSLIAKSKTQEQK